MSKTKIKRRSQFVDLTAPIHPLSQLPLHRGACGCFDFGYTEGIADRGKQKIRPAIFTGRIVFYSSRSLVQ